jgi:NADH:ubiquinone oxidoreductase subunit F (NADH-binding)
MSVAAARVEWALPAADSLPRLLAGIHTDGTAVSLDEHLDSRGPLPSANDLIELVEASGLRGRGGASFPTGRKFRAVAHARGRPVVVANGAEGELISDKDKALLRSAPHLVLDGVQLAAAALGAREAIVAIGAGARHELAAMRGALTERERRRTGGRASLRLVTVPEGFVAGEETALVTWLSGGLPKPTFTPPRPFERGVRGAPTLVQNVETFAQIALVARFGPQWFRALGTSEDPGTALVTLGGAVRRPGVYEIPLGLPLHELLEWAGGTTVPLSACLIGGYFGTWVDAASVQRLSLSESGLHPAGASLGTGAIYALPATACGVLETARVARYLADESAGQCGPCVHGLDAIATELERLAAGRGGDVERIARWSRQVTGRGACRHPDGAARFVESALAVFTDEIERHTHGRCRGEHLTRLPVERTR